MIEKENSDVLVEAFKMCTEDACDVCMLDAKNPSGLPHLAWKRGDLRKT